MVALVVDASVVIAWSMPDEGGDYPAYVESAVLREGMLVPAHWHFEAANAVRMMEVRSRLSSEDGQELLVKLELLKIEVDRESNHRAFHAATALARCHGLTVYDAAYLELALRAGRRLASLDGPLLRAAAAEGVAFMDIAA